MSAFQYEQERIVGTRVEKFGAVCIGEFPKEAENELYFRNKLWNSFVEIHRDSIKKFEESRCEVSVEYKKIQNSIAELNVKIDELYAENREVRKTTGSRDGSTFEEKFVKQKIKELKNEMFDLYIKQKKIQIQVDKLIDKKPLNEEKKNRLNTANRKENNGGMISTTAGQVRLDFIEAEKKIFKTPGATLKFHQFQQEGYFYYRFRRKNVNIDGVFFDEFMRKGEKDRRPFTLVHIYDDKNGRKFYDLRVKLAEGENKVYHNFHLVVHRPIPPDAQINNAKLIRERIGDRFKYYVCMSVRFPDPDLKPINPDGIIGIDMGFKQDGDSLRVASFNIGKKVEHIVLPKKYISRNKYYRNLQSDLSNSALKVGDYIKPHIRNFFKSIEEDHEMYKIVKQMNGVLVAKNKLPFELLYKLGKMLFKNGGGLPNVIAKEVVLWYKQWRSKYREMHDIRSKNLKYRKHFYREWASKLVGFGEIIGIEKINWSSFALRKQGDNELSNKALSQRFDAAPGSFIESIINCANREGIHIVKVDPAWTSKKCSNCGNVNKKLKSERIWTCPKCNTEHDRDYNSPINIAEKARKEIKNKIEN